MKKTVIAIIGLCAALGAWAQQWGQVNTSVAHMRATATNKAEIVSQDLMGMPVKLLEKDGGWWKIETCDGYNGWMSEDVIVTKSDQEMDQWRRAPRLVVTSLGQIATYDSPTGSAPRNVVTDLVPNNIVLGDLSSAENGRVRITLPDGRQAWACAAYFTPIEEWAARPFSPQIVLDQAYSLIGTPYLWGGASTKALDCSGLAKTCYLANGIFLRRDASMQARTGQQLDIKKWNEFRPGDLLFFGNTKTGKVTHVAVYDRDGIFVHSTGYGERVRTNSVDPESPDYRASSMLSATRIDGQVGTDGIVKASDHPWLF